MWVNRAAAFCKGKSLGFGVFWGFSGSFLGEWVASGLGIPGQRGVFRRQESADQRILPPHRLKRTFLACQCIVFDVVVVSNSHWLKVFFDGDVQFVLQIIEDDKQEVFASNRNKLRLIGWKRDSFALRDDE